MAPNILGTIAQGHPNWFPGQKPPAQPKPPGGFLGTVKAGHPNWFPSVPGSPVGSVYHQGPAAPGAAPNAQHPQNSATAQPGASTPGGGSSPGDPALDATYYANVAANNFKVNNQINGLNLQGTQANTALQSALAQLAYQQPRAQLALEQRANQGGGLYSSVYGQNLGNLTEQYATKQTGAQQNFTNTEDRINAQIAALQQGEPIYNAGQAAAATGRAAKLAANDPGLGQGTGGLNTNPGAGGGTKPGGTKPPVSNRAGKNAKGRLTVKVGTALGGGKGLNVGRTLPTLSGKPSAPKKNPPTTIRRTGIPGHGVVRTRLGGR